jgi:sRNA-binding protein
MKTPTAPGTGRQGVQVVNSDCSNNSNTAALPPRQELTVSPAGRDGQELIAVLAELFPAVVVADRWKPHRPLKLGIHRDLVDRGVLLPDECRAVLRRYCSRLMYHRAVAAGGPRFDLDGHAAGEVAPDEADRAKAAVAAIEAKRAASAKAVAAEREAAVKAAKAPVPPKAPKAARPADRTPPAKPGLSLDGLRAAARARREAPHG